MTTTQLDETPFAADSAPPSPRDEAVIQCVGLSKVFRDFWMRNRVRAVDAVDLTINRGEVFGLLGPNGSGKTTTIKLILGLLHPTAGRVIALGKRPDNVAVKKLIGYLPEESYLYRFLSARETLDYYARLFCLDAAQRRQRADMLLQMVGLDAVQHRPVGEYSKGMQRRIGLAQALINDPQLLILDEPTAGLDPIGTRQIKDLIRELARRGKTVLLCSHLLADVEDVCDRVAVMFGGKVRAMDTVDRLLTQQDTTLLKTQQLDECMIKAIEKSLQGYGKHLESVEHPRVKLETLFMDIVRRAQEQDATTSGAHSGGRIAPFLVGGGTVTPHEDATAPVKDDGKPNTELIDSLLGRWQTKSEDEHPPTAGSEVHSDAAAAEAAPPTPGTEKDQHPDPYTVESDPYAVEDEEKYPPIDNDVLDSLISGKPEAELEAGANEASATPDEPPVKKPVDSSTTNDKTEGDEAPDGSFLDAITWVPPFEGDQNESPDDDAAEEEDTNKSGPG